MNDIARISGIDTSSPIAVVTSAKLMSFIQVRMGRLLDHVQQYTAVFLEDFEAQRNPGGNS